MEAQSMTAGPAIATTFRWRRFLVVAGPGLVVMLADTDAGSIITAAQSGAQWGYRLLALQFLLVPILYIVQELTVRLGAATGKGHARLILEPLRTVLGLVFDRNADRLLRWRAAQRVLRHRRRRRADGRPAPVSLTLVVSVLLAIAFTRSYRSVERIALFVGAFELVFLLVAWLAHPSLSEIATGFVSIPLGDPKYLYLASANIGAVIMPWMVFFQQSSIVEKKLKAADIRAERIDTAIGAVVTQIIMAAVLIATAATLGKSGGGQALDTVQDISAAITPFLGSIGGNLLFGLGIAGAALVATIVVTLAAARTLGEVLGVNHSLDHEVSEAPWFYGAYAAALIGGALVVASGVNLVALSVGVQVMNALLLPIVLGFLYLLARGLPEPWRLQGWYAWFSGGLIAVTTVFGVYSGLAGLWG